MENRRFILKNYKKEVKKSEGCGIIYMQGEKKSPHKFKVILNNSLQKSNSNLVKVAVTVNGKTGQYSSHRWKNPTVAFDILKESLKEAGIKNPDTVTFINKKTGKEVNKDTLMAHYKRRGNPLTLQEFVKENYEIKEDSKLGNGDGGDDGGHVKRLHEMILNTETNTTEHAGEDSLKKHTDENGKLTEEREKLHREIILEHFKGLNPVEGQGIYVIMGGGSGSGKSYVIEKGLVKLPEQVVKIDSDYIKGKLPEYNEMIRNQMEDEAAGYAHEESSALAKRIQTIALTLNYNTLLDGTGNGSKQSLGNKIQEGKSKGYKIIGEYVTIPIDEALKRAEIRGVKTGRFVDKDTIINIHKKVTHRAIEFANEFDEIRLYDNTNEPMLIALGGNGKTLEALSGKEKQFKDFLNKGDI